MNAGFTFIECDQGTPEWHAARAGLCTASRFADAISVLTRASGSRKAGDPSAAAERYAADLAIERVSGKMFGEPAKAWVLERGHDLERLARMAYEEKHAAFVTEAGICIDGNGFGYSTDGLVNDDGLIEIKCPIAGDKILSMWQTGDVSEYAHQMQGGMWLTGRKWCDFIMYCPDLAAVNKDLFVKRIYRDDAFIDDMVLKLAQFQKMVTANYKMLTDAPAPADAEPVVVQAPRAGSRLAAILTTPAE